MISLQTASTWVGKDRSGYKICLQMLEAGYRLRWLPKGEVALTPLAFPCLTIRFHKAAIYFKSQRLRYGNPNVSLSHFAGATK